MRVSIASGTEQLYDTTDFGAYQEVSARWRKDREDIRNAWSCVDSSKPLRMFGFKPKHV
jgi:hypothetical protein